MELLPTLCFLYTLETGEEGYLNFNIKSEKYLQALEGLPAEHRATFTQLVDEYAYHAHLLYGRNWVAYKVLAELVKSGWRPSEADNNKKDDNYE